jgi:integrase/recombinase XerD
MVVPTIRLRANAAVHARGFIVTIPLAPRTARAIDLAVGDRCTGPVFLDPDGHRPDRHGAARIVRQVARRAGITKAVGPHTLRHAFITAALDAGVPLRDGRKPPHTRIREQLCVTTGPARPWTRHAAYTVAAYLAGAAR